MNSADMVLEAVCAEFHIDRAELLRRSTSRPLPLRRHIAAYLMRTAKMATLQEIGCALEMHHTTIIHGINVIRGLVDVDPQLAALVTRLRRAIDGMPVPLQDDPAADVTHADGQTKCEIRLRDRAKMIERFGFDETDAPRAGVACVLCRELAHFCQAQGWCGEYAVCRACGRMEPCGQAQVRAMAGVLTKADLYGEDAR